MKNEQLITLFNKPIDELSRADVETEIKMQKFHRGMLRAELARQKKNDEKAVRAYKVRYDKIDFLETYIKVIDGFIDEMERKIATRSDGTKEGRARAIRNKENRKDLRREARNWSISSDGIQLSWDRKKFMLVARDRGYLTEASIIYAVEQELKLTKEKVNVLLEKGKFTWGQVLCLGAMLQMTPKEFCDIFLAGYFVDYYGQFIASYENLDKSVLLKRATTIPKKELAKIDTAIAEMEAAAD